MNLDGKRVLITGHTGFKGAWLALYAHHTGAEVGGYSLHRSGGPSVYGATGLRRLLAHETRADVTDPVALRGSLRAFRPDVVLHLAARAIVKDGFSDPYGTTYANVMGTTAVLEAVRHSPSVKATVVATTDKVYANDGTPQTEDHPIGGKDPYGASKAAAEMVVNGYRATFGVHVATARSGNVVGGGDYGAHRLVPNCLAAFDAGESAQIYDATRPFLHVLDSVRGYLMLSSAMLDGYDPGALNFGPRESYEVRSVAQYLAAQCGGSIECVDTPPEKEAHRLSLDAGRARAELGWEPRWGLHTALDRTVAWHEASNEGADMELVSLEQVHEHDTKGQRWAA